MWPSFVALGLAGGKKEGGRLLALPSGLVDAANPWEVIQRFYEVHEKLVVLGWFIMFSVLVTPLVSVVGVITQVFPGKCA